MSRGQEIIKKVIIRLAAYYGAACLVLSILLGEFAFYPARSSPERSTAEGVTSRFNAVLEDAAVTTIDGVRLQAWFAHPAQCNGDAVILLHGVGDNRRGMIGFAGMFLSQGYDVLLPDSRGQGASGGFPTYGIREVDDVRSWCSWLARHHPPHCLFGMGESMGAAIVLQAAKEIPFCAVVAESSFASFRDIAYLRVGQFFGTGSWMGRIVLRPAVELAFEYGWLTRGIRLSAVSPEMSIAESKVPILLIHGMADASIPCQQSERILAHNPTHITLWEVPNAQHVGAAHTAGQEFRERVLGWFASHRSLIPSERLIDSTEPGRDEM